MPTDVDNVVAATLQAFGRIDVLVNNAGVVDDAPFLDLAIEEGLKTSFIPLRYGDDDVAWQQRVAAWADTRTVVGASDAGAHLDMIDTFSFTTQMLGKAVARRGLLSVEQAVHHLTEVPARLVGLKERGLLREGYHADIVVFDPKRVDCGATYTRADLPGPVVSGGKTAWAAAAAADAPETAVASA